ncbi:hypothetical protein IIQ_03351 [Bacillus cereus VD118]|uniref:Antirepressor protein C-terminal domain-containing protein n=2 Tax=Bacillus cereus group TaxID=86661 RepID=R8Q1A4_BACCE|nr:hypothetical protein IIQ_03351 [Bacillus cereus VD118]SCB70430.1 Uncharacterized protein BWGO95_04600 [Bacillus mycoides]
MGIKAENLVIELNFGEETLKPAIKPVITAVQDTEKPVIIEGDALTDPKNVAQREKYIERIEVLHRVEGLLLLPVMEMATTKQVAAFYNVPHSTLKAVIQRNNDELEQDGMYLAKYSEIKETVKMYNASLLESGVGYRGAYVFPKRAILRIGMLLRDSEIAREVRTQLLNIEENTETSTKIIEVNKEIELQHEVAKALISGDLMALAQATAKVSEYKNRHIAKVEGERDQYKAELDVINGTDLISLRNVGLEYLDGISSANLRKFLQYQGVLSNVRADGHYTANVKYAKYFKLSTTVKNDRLCKTLKATREGAIFIAELYEKHNIKKSA